MYYDKQIRYIDYLENGEKQRNCGYVKITVADHRLLMDMQIKGLYETDDVASEVVLEGAGAEGRLGTVLIRQGSGSFQWEHQDPVNEGEALVLGQGLNYGQLERIRVQISPRRSLWCVWRESAPGRSGAKQNMTEQSASGGNASGQSAYEQNISDRKPGEISSMTADAMPGREQNGVVGHRGAVPAEPVQWETGQESRAYPALRGEISETQGYAAMPEKATEAEGRAATLGSMSEAEGSAAMSGNVPETEGSAVIPGSVPETEGSAAIPGSMPEAEGRAAIPGSMSEAGGRAAIPGSMSEARESAAIPGSMSEARESAAIPGSMSEAGGRAVIPGSMPEAEGWASTQGAAQAPRGLAPGYDNGQGGNPSFRTTTETAGEETEYGSDRERRKTSAAEESVQARIISENSREEAFSAFVMPDYAAGNYEHNTKNMAASQTGGGAGQKTESKAEASLEKAELPQIENGGKRRTGTVSEKRRPASGPQAPTMASMSEDKWQQLLKIYPHIHPFQDEREYLSLRPEDFVILQSNAYRLVQNSFLLHGYFNYDHLILAQVSRKSGSQYYIGVPGNFYEKEKQVAIMYGFSSFECRREPAEEGDFGYYMIKVEL